MKHTCFLGILFIFCVGWMACATRHSAPISGPMTHQDAQVLRGKQLYDKYCASCHPAGEAGVGPGLNSLHVPAFVKRFQVRHGLGAMPAFKKDEISNQELHDIMQYMHALQHNK